MAYDRFVAICQPLHYHTKMTVRKTVTLWMTGVSYPFMCCSVGLYLTIQTPLCDNKLTRLFCTNWTVVKNSCVDTTLSNAFDLSLIRLETIKINPIITAVLSLEYLMVPSINNPLIYGLKLPQIRAAVSQRFRVRVKTALLNFQASERGVHQSNTTLCSPLTSRGKKDWHRVASSKSDYTCATIRGCAKPPQSIAPTHPTRGANDQRPQGKDSRIQGYLSQEHPFLL
ncbi:hypothetical protein WMY93_002008 [Mugilogobius chulae]|uniref:G-protein coupled receptors family 1 profile domain-containing protein n=1 Tax=Mugilogobius chulae TaxID=88201 RepID=A0AAW0Q3A2_9GOBI